jgi:hypothetical protein
MADRPQQADRVARAIAASSRTSTTPPGQTDPRPAGWPAETVEAINQVFALFRLNYHNQYYAAFPDASPLKQIKKLWLESLGRYPVEQLLQGAKHAIENSEYLPTLNRMHDSCQAAITELGLPAPRDAYLEACNMPSPKSEQDWSHPAVYLAGRDSNWFYLSNTPEAQARPVFEGHYRDYCRRALRGEELQMPAHAALTQQPPEPLSAEEQLSRLQQLRRENDL